MEMTNERMMVLNMLDEGVITVQQALDLIHAMSDGLSQLAGQPIATIELPKFSLVLG